LRVELPSTRPDGTHNWVEIRDKKRPLDSAAIQEAIKVVVEVAPDGTETRYAVGGQEERMRIGLLARAITAWSFDGTPVPSQNIAKPEEVIDSVFGEDDWDVVYDAIQPLLDRVLRRPKTTTGP
jgi:hypothetical protein